MEATVEGAISPMISARKSNKNQTGALRRSRLFDRLIAIYIVLTDLEAAATPRPVGLELPTLCLTGNFCESEPNRNAKAGKALDAFACSNKQAKGYKLFTVFSNWFKTAKAFLRKQERRRSPALFGQNGRILLFPSRRSGSAIFPEKFQNTCRCCVRSVVDALARAEHGAWA